MSQADELTRMIQRVVNNLLWDRIPPVTLARVDVVPQEDFHLCHLDIDYREGEIVATAKITEGWGVPTKHKFWASTCVVLGASPWSADYPHPGMECRVIRYADICRVRSKKVRARDNPVASHYQICQVCHGGQSALAGTATEAAERVMRMHLSDLGLTSWAVG